MKPFIALSLTSLLTTASAAGDFPLAGTWKLDAVHREVMATGQRTEPYGAQPEGLLVFTPEGRMIGLIVPSATDSAGAAVPRNLVAYSGPYTSEGPGKVAYHVDISISPTQKGTVTARTYTLVGDKLTLVTIPAKGPDGQETRTVLEWRRSK